MKFQKGQKIVCMHNYRSNKFPKNGEVVTVDDHSQNSDGFITLVEYQGFVKVRMLFDERYFDELIDDSVLLSLLK